MLPFFLSELFVLVQSSFCDVFFLHCEMVPSSSGGSSDKLRKNFHVTLVGSISNQSVGAKLLLNHQILSSFFFFLHCKNCKSYKKGEIQEVTIFWQNAQILSRRTDNCVDNVLKLYNEGKGLQKILTRTAGKEKEKKRERFVEMMDDLFGVTHSAALGQMKTEEDKKFLMF